MIVVISMMIYSTFNRGSERTIDRTAENHRGTTVGVDELCKTYPKIYYGYITSSIRQAVASGEHLNAWRHPQIKHYMKHSIHGVTKSTSENGLGQSQRKGTRQQEKCFCAKLNEKPYCNPA